MNTGLEEEFRRRAPWITKFIVDGKEYGGAYDAFHDSRLDLYFHRFPAPETILELGSLEGGHTIRLATRENVKSVMALEGRETNVEKAAFMARLYGIKNAEFVRADLERVDLPKFGHFDSVFCVGVLYHLSEPWTLVEQIAKVTRKLFLWTHYVKEEQATQIVSGFRGRKYREGGFEDPLSGLSKWSFWLTLGSLLELLITNGFEHLDILSNDPTGKNGPCVTVAAVSDS